MMLNQAIRVWIKRNLIAPHAEKATPNTATSVKGVHKIVLPSPLLAQDWVK